MSEHNHDLTRAYFDSTSDYWQAIYESDAPKTYAAYRLRQQHQFALAFVRSHSHIQQVLELGCGAGLLAMDFAEAGYNVTAVDIAPKMIERAQAMAKARQVEVDWRVDKAETLPDADGRYDAVIALGLLSNIPKLDAALAEMWRVVRPGGVLVVTMPNAFALDVWVALPRSLSIMIWSPRFRRLTARIGNIWRFVRRRPLKDPQALRYGRTMSSFAMLKKLQAAHFDDVQPHARAYGPMMPFGIRRFSDERCIHWSDNLVEHGQQSHWLTHLGTTMIYTATKPAP